MQACHADSALNPGLQCLRATGAKGDSGEVSFSICWFAELGYSQVV